MNNNAIRAKLLAIKKLAERGVGGEKSNAEQLLKALCAKHKINPEDITVERIFELNVGKKGTFKHDLAIAVCCKIFGYAGFVEFGCRVHRRNLIVDIETMPDIFADLEGTIGMMLSHHKKEMEIFNSAFIHRHNLAIDTKEDREINPKDFQRHLRIAEMARSIDKKDYVKQI